MFLRFLSIFSVVVFFFFFFCVHGLFALSSCHRISWRASSREKKPFRSTNRKSWRRFRFWVKRLRKDSRTWTSRWSSYCRRSREVTDELWTTSWSKEISAVWRLQKEIQVQTTRWHHWTWSVFMNKVIIALWTVKPSEIHPGLVISDLPSTLHLFPAFCTPVVHSQREKT